MNDGKLRHAYIVVPGQATDGGRQMYPHVSYAVSIKEDTPNIEKVIESRASETLKNYEEVYVYKLVKVGKRAVNFVDYPSGNEAKAVETKKVVDDVQI